MQDSSTASRPPAAAPAPGPWMPISHPGRAGAYVVCRMVPGDVGALRPEYLLDITHGHPMSFAVLEVARWYAQRANARAA